MASSSSSRSSSRKRSYEDMNEEKKDAKDLIVDELDQAASQPTSTWQAADVPTSQISIKRESSMAPPSQKPSHSRDGSQVSGNSQDGTKPQTKELTNVEAGESFDDDMSDENGPIEPQVLDEPGDTIREFDWDDLQQRYHDRISELQDEERNILEDFEGLCHYFGVWAQSGSAREVDRSFKRMKTQMTFVQNLEDELEKKRQHYIKVVEAFKSALDLLTS